jgi:polysaccharide deacetylase family protein (PEP-CTERM system associated)
MKSLASLSGEVINAFTVDVEDWFQVSAFEQQLPRSAWAQLPVRLEANVEKLLELLQQHAVCATFFTLGWVAERYPAVVRAIVHAGHELASHGYDHRRVSTLNAAQFRADLDRARCLLEDVSGQRVRGYRAPTFSFNDQTPWVYDALAETGHCYSSSVAPLRHDAYGQPDAPRAAYRAAAGMLEIPVSTVRLACRNFPCAGGGFFRLYPYALFRWGLRRINQHDRLPGMFYIHPWELDPEQPEVPDAPRLARWRHRLNLGLVEARLQRLLGDFRWGRVDAVYPL